VVDPSVHTAYYRFDTLEQVEAISHGQEIGALIAEFDRAWGPKVVRTRDILVVADEVKG
jgi:hypothetical protein